MEKIKLEKPVESSEYFLAKKRFLEELGFLSAKHDEGNSQFTGRRTWGEKIAKIKAGEKLSRTEATALQVAIEIAHRSGLSGAEYDAFIKEFFVEPRRRRDDDD
ncbi:MAG: hypothetical protein A2945_05510 [Candidatus Liptonbacteria bacterium RIFCSPLOWO2_01_FULL_52_25]|uniref:Uncharacterized protein n=1 Tax=Candidatus Liptonbacteria bacterium RIFCSPLOWO2_01_FULL_52_25 TaxID=1798650 RepID=A0A1G2CCV5_9BACT|nr:MAG: hypothetical protein A2945_05510 [Candidatus Liptonbacteria bacterium RIFCSPLOWO2_01_FULL_52_25]